MCAYVLFNEMARGARLVEPIAVKAYRSPNSAISRFLRLGEYQNR